MHVRNTRASNNSFDSIEYLNYLCLSNEYAVVGAFENCECSRSAIEIERHSDTRSKQSESHQQRAPCYIKSN